MGCSLSHGRSFKTGNLKCTLGSIGSKRAAYAASSEDNKKNVFQHAEV